MGDTLPPNREDHEDGDDLSVVAGHLNVSNAIVVRAVRAAIDTNTSHGCRSLSHWLTIELGCAPAVASRYVDIAERADDFPTIMGMFNRGELSLDQTHVIVMNAPAWADHMLVNMSQAATVSQLRKVIRAKYFDGPDTPSGNEEVDTQPAQGGGGDDTDSGDSASADAPTAGANLADRDRLSFGWTGNRFTGSFDLSADTGAILEAALNEARDALFRDGLADVTWTDALREIALRSLAGLPLARQQMFKLQLHVGIDDPDASTRFTNGVAIPASVRDYITCTADQRPVWERDNQPVGVGRTQRVVPQRTRTLIEYRDQGCRVPGCTATHVEVHHIVHWRDGGPTDPENLVSLCSRHHRLHHQGEVRITGTANDLTITDRTGQPLKTGPTPILPTGPPDEPEVPYRHPSGERLDTRWFTGWTHPVVRERHEATLAKHRAAMARQYQAA